MTTQIPLYITIKQFVWLLIVNNVTAFTDKKHNAHSVFFEQLTNEHCVPTL